jgi:hypothetical protein
MDRILVGGVFLLCALSTGLMLAQTDEQQTIAPEELGKNMKNYVGVEHSFKDTMAYIYKDLREFHGYLKFDTSCVRCRIVIKDVEDARLLQIWSRGEVETPEKMEFKDPNLQLIKEVYFARIEPHPLAFSGKVIDCDTEKVKGSISFGYQYIFEVDKVERVKYQKK